MFTESACPELHTKENTLLGQALITDPKKSVSSFLSEISKNNNINLNIASMDLYTI